MTTRLTKEKDIVWKAKDQTCVVLIEVKGKVYQVVLDEGQMNSLISVLPELFSDGKVHISKENLSGVSFHKLSVKKTK